jgi:molybdate transport system substrate-binding protein
MPGPRTLFALLLLAATASVSQLRSAEPPLLVFAAASLTESLTEIAGAYEAETGREVTLSFAGSMALARQIEASAGVDVFVSADQESMDYLAERGLIAPDTRRDLLANRLVLICPAAEPGALAIGPGFDVVGALAGGRLALANTESVPAGRYAKAALTALGVWDAASAHLAQAEDVRGALALVARAEAPLGIVYATDARVEPDVRVVGMFPEATHPPILYPAALTAEARPGAAAFLQYLEGNTARAVFTGAGFALRAAPAP